MIIPKEADKEVCQQLEQLAEAGAVLEKGGHGDKVLGHLSLRDPKGRGFWMKRSGISLAELQGPQDFILLDFEGKKKAGEGIRHAEWPIHGEIFLARPDVNVVGHTHPYNAGVISTTEEPIEALTEAGTFFSSGLPRYRETSNLIIDKNMGAELASALGAAKAVLMRNHGITYVGSDVAECVVAGLLCEYACRDQLRAAMSNLTFEISATAASSSHHDINLSVAEAWQSLRRQVTKTTGFKPKEGADTNVNRFVEANRILSNEGVEFLNCDLVAFKDPSGGIICGLPELSLGEISGSDDLIRLENAPKHYRGVNYLKKVFATLPKTEAAIYCCAPSVALFSSAAEPLCPTGDEGKHFEGLSVRLSPDQAIENIPADTRVVFLPNEGAIILANSLEVACLRAIFLERACNVQIDAAATGLAWGWLPDSEQGVVGMTLEGQGQIDNFWSFYRRKLSRKDAGQPLPGE